MKLRKGAVENLQQRRFAGTVRADDAESVAGADQPCHVIEDLTTGDGDLLRGGLGTTHFAPIVNAPEVAILGVSKSSMEPVWNGKEFMPRLMMPISLSFDHRVIDGADGARFITIINNMLSDIRRLVM